MGDALVGAIVFLAGTVVAGAGLRLHWLIALPWQVAVGCAIAFVHLGPRGQAASERQRARLRLRLPRRWGLWLGPANLGALAFGYGISGVIIAITERPFSLIAPSGPSPLSEMTRTATGWLVVTSYTVAAAPVVEELAFRGWIMRSLETRMRAWKAILITAFAFGVAHAWYGRAVFVLVPFTLGLLWGACAFRSGSTWTAAVLHGTWNLSIMIGTAIDPDEPLWMFPDYHSRALELSVPAGIAAIGWSVLWAVMGRADRPRRERESGSASSDPADLRAPEG
jgi:membrane protease YdiL (CAAX protease family)